MEKELYARVAWQGFLDFQNVKIFQTGEAAWWPINPITTIMMVTTHNSNNNRSSLALCPYDPYYSILIYIGWSLSLFSLTLLMLSLVTHSSIWFADTTAFFTDSARLLWSNWTWASWAFGTGKSLLVIWWNMVKLQLPDLSWWTPQNHSNSTFRLASTLGCSRSQSCSLQIGVWQSTPTDFVCFMVKSQGPMTYE